jgi:hypothetical protein
VPSRLFFASALAAGLLFSLAACSTQGSSPESVIGEAFAGPAEVKIRSDIPLDSRVVATVHHGERLELLRQRRNIFFLVRTPKGLEGWTESRQLLSGEDMASLNDLTERAKALPSQGAATSYGELRVHSRPSRSSAAFASVKEGEKVDVLSYVVAPRVAEPRKPLIPPVPKKQKAPKKPAKEAKIPPPPMPAPPKLPKNWLDLSRPDPSIEEKAEAELKAQDERAEPETPPVPVDYWTLVRLRDGRAGWVLTRPLVLSIPDEIAQYAEGARIVAYFAAGEVQDGDQAKKNWLWATLSQGPQPYDFDSFRVFIWSVRRHRYETAYIERKLKGYLPILMKNVDYGAGAKSQVASGSYPGFSICMEKADGSRWRRDYAFITNVVRFAGERPCESAPSSQTTVAPAVPTILQQAQPPQTSKGFLQKWKDSVRAAWKRLPKF